VLFVSGKRWRDDWCQLQIIFLTNWHKQLCLAYCLSYSYVFFCNTRINVVVFAICILAAAVGVAKWK